MTFAVLVLDVYPDGRAYNLDEAKGVVAVNRVHHSKQYPSGSTVTVVRPPAATARPH